LSLSREALATRAGGIAASTIQRFESGKTCPEAATLAAIARALDQEERRLRRRLLRVPEALLCEALEIGWTREQLLFAPNGNTPTNNASTNNNGDLSHAPVH
jgi:transcriptional regulator with XRE-family HTH domain